MSGRRCRLLDQRRGAVSPYVRLAGRWWGGRRSHGGKRRFLRGALLVSGHGYPGAYRLVQSELHVESVDCADLR